MVVRATEAGKPRCEVINFQSRFDRCCDVSAGVGEGKRDLLSGRGACRADVVAGDRDCVPIRHLGRTICEGVGDQSKTRLWGVNIRSAGDVFLEDVILDRTAYFVETDALFSG